MEYMSREDYCVEYCGIENREGYKTCHNCNILTIPTVNIPYKWIDVKKKLPDKNNVCLIWYEYDGIWGRFRHYGISWYGNQGWRKCHLEGDNIEILYWCPLPEPPETND